MRARRPSWASVRDRLRVALARMPGLSTWVIREFHRRRYARHFHRRPNLDRPRLFTEYILHRIIYDRDPLLKVASDKIEVRRWIDRVLGPGYSVPLLGAWDSANRIAWSRLAPPFVLKPNHASGAFHIVHSLEPHDIPQLTTMAARWIERDYFDGSFEWGYRGLPRRITAEPLLASPDGGSLIEVDVFTFHGEPRILLAFTGPKTSHSQRCAMWIDATGERSNLWGSTARAEDVLDPAGVMRMQAEVEAARAPMLELSRRIGAHFSYVRVDFYITDDGLKIGELTTYPAAGLGIYRPDDADARLGAMLRETGLRRRERGLKPYRWPPLH
jgi:hypothetical protein